MNPFDFARAEALIATFNRATNRLIAGSRIAVFGDDAFARGLAQILRDMGARVTHPDGVADGDETIAFLPRPEGRAATDALLTKWRHWLEGKGATPQLIVVDEGAVLETAVPAESRHLPAGITLLREAPRMHGAEQPDEPEENTHREVCVVSPVATTGPPQQQEPTNPEPPSLAHLGSARIDWAARFMPVTRTIAEQLAQTGDLRGLRIAVVLVLEPKTAVLVLELARVGADVRVFAPANEVDPQAAAALRARGIVVLGGADATAEQEAELVRDLLRWQPQLIIDDGAHVIRLAHETPGALDALRGAAEETTSGVRPLQHMHEDGALRVPVVPVNDALVKTLFDNRHGTGQTCVFAIIDELRTLRSIGESDKIDPPHVSRYTPPETAASTWLVLGYGPVGEGVCRHARALGARVVVAELDPVRALAAEADGFDVAVAAEAAARADVIVSATGVPGTIDRALAQCARAGTVCAVAGGVDGELDFGDAVWVDIDSHISRVSVAEHTVHVLGHGYGINYTSSGGNPIEIMDLSFAAQLAAVQQLVAIGALDERERPTPGLFPLEQDREHEIARLALAARGEHVDTSSEDQAAAARNWRNARYAGAEGGIHGAAHDTATSREQPEQAGATPLIAAPPMPPATPTVTVYSADLVIPITAPRVKNGAVAVRGDRIVHVGEREWVLASLRESGLDFTEEYWPGVITPGLVNAHTHLQYTDMAAVATRTYNGFDDWSKAFDAVYYDEVYSGDTLGDSAHDWSAAAARGAQLALASGTTACADVVTDRSAVSALHDAGLHGIAYWEVMGWSNAEWQASGRDVTIADLDSMPATPGVGVSPHAPYSLEVQPLLDVPDIVRNRGMRLHIHLAEAHMEREHQAGHDTWPELEAESFRALRSRGVGVSSTQFVDHLGVLGPDCHIAHGVYMTARDRSLLRARGTSVALCPRSNRVIGLHMPPVAAYLREGNPICVGTDSLSSAPSLDPLADVGLLYRVAREQGYGEADLHQRLLNAATLGGAHALGQGDGMQRIGQLSVGALADLAFFDIRAKSADDVLAHIVEDGAGTCRRTVVAGVLKFDASMTASKGYS